MGMFFHSSQAAPDRPDPYVRLALTKAAQGDFVGAVSFAKLMADVDPTYPGRAESLEQLLGHQNGVSRLQIKQKVADWTKIDVRDPDRVFLLGLVLFLDGDERFRTLLETAVKLGGDQPHLKAFLDSVPARDRDAVAPTPDEIDALAAPKLGAARPLNPVPRPVPVPAKAKPTLPAPLPLLLPPSLPEPPAP